MNVRPPSELEIPVEVTDNRFRDASQKGWGYGFPYITFAAAQPCQARSYDRRCVALDEKDFDLACIPCRARVLVTAMKNKGCSYDPPSQSCSGGSADSGACSGYGCMRALLTSGKLK